jgi:hypothetical protein
MELRKNLAKKPLVLIRDFQERWHKNEMTAGGQASSERQTPNFW